MKLALIGLGLIGGSLGLAVRAAGLAERVVGYDASELERSLALERGAVDALASSPAEAVRGAELVVLATPVMAMQALLAELAPDLAPGAVVTDVASTKACVQAWAAAALPPGVTFVGGHPMAGSEKSGMGAARANLFRGAVYCVTAGPATSEVAIARVEDLARGIGARPLRLEAEAHDAAVAAVSHLPFIAATALVEETALDARWELWSRIAATGYRDATRLAAGHPAMYRDICQTNAGAIAPGLRALAARLLDIADHLEDPGYLTALFSDARTRREAWQAGQTTFQSGNG